MQGTMINSIIDIKKNYAAYNIINNYVIMEAEYQNKRRENSITTITNTTTSLTLPALLVSIRKLNNSAVGPHEMHYEYLSYQMFP